MINHKHKFLFIHIPRTGGSSIESQFNYKENKEKNKHWTLSDWKRTLGPEVFDEYFKFAFVRNPWSRAVSDYLFYTQGKTVTFKDFLLKPNECMPNQIDPAHLMEQHHFICDENNNLMVDFLGRFESLQQDFDIISDRINCPRQQLPHNNKSCLQGSYKSYYNQETYDIVKQKFAQDIKLFNYKFN